MKALILNFMHYVESLGLDLNYHFVRNPLYEETNYIYSIYLAKEFLEDTDLLLLHGDLVVEDAVFFDFCEQEGSFMAGSTTKELPEKDFKAEITDGKISKIGIFWRRGWRSATVSLCRLKKLSV